jgi:rhodanese-related sulfurtransferase
MTFSPIIAHLMLFASLSLPLTAAAVDPATLPAIKVSKLGLYLEAKDVPDFIARQNGKVLFLDLRTPEEVFFVGAPTTIDANLPSHFVHYDQWNDKTSGYLRLPNPKLTTEFEKMAAAKGLAKTDAVVLICRSGDRSAEVAGKFGTLGYNNVWSVVDGIEGDLAKDGAHKGQRTVNGWKNAGLPWTYKLARSKAYLMQP